MRIKPKRKKPVAQGKIRVLFLEDKDTGGWTAQCLEHDIAVQAKTVEDLKYELERMIAAQVSLGKKLKRKPFENIARAPQVFFDLYKKSEMPFERFRGMAMNNMPQPVYYPRVAQLQAAANR